MTDQITELELLRDRFHQWALWANESQQVRLAYLNCAREVEATIVRVARAEQKAKDDIMRFMYGEPERTSEAI